MMYDGLRLNPKCFDQVIGKSPRPMKKLEPSLRSVAQNPAAGDRARAASLLSAIKETDIRGEIIRRRISDYTKRLKKFA